MFTSNTYLWTLCVRLRITIPSLPPTVAQAGHYTAFARSPVTGDWHYFNDDSVTRQKPREEEYSTSYLLFYHRKGNVCVCVCCLVLLFVFCGVRLMYIYVSVVLKY